MSNVTELRWKKRVSTAGSVFQVHRAGVLVLDVSYVSGDFAIVYAFRNGIVVRYQLISEDRFIV